MATHWLSNLVMDEPSFFHQWQLDDDLERYTEQHIAVAFGQEPDRAMLPQQQQQQQHCSAVIPRECHSWDSCVTEQGSPPLEASSAAILSFGGARCGPALRPKEEAAAAAASPGLLRQGARPGKRGYDAMVAAATAAPPASRPASQNQEHILAERKRREKLSQRFIALSKIVPGLKKMDKASVLGDAIRYVKQLQEQVTALEEDAKRRPVEAAVLVSKSQLSVVDDDGEGSSCVDESSEGFGRRAAPGLPEIEARVSERTVLVKIHCENRKGALVTALSELESIGLAIVNTNVLPFTASSLDITIMATAAEGFSMSVKDIVKRLNQAFK